MCEALGLIPHITRKKVTLNFLLPIKTLPLVLFSQTTSALNPQQLLAFPLPLQLHCFHSVIEIELHSFYYAGCQFLEVFSFVPT